MEQCRLGRLQMLLELHILSLFFSHCLSRRTHTREYICWLWAYLLSSVLRKGWLLVHLQVHVDLAILAYN